MGVRQPEPERDQFTPRSYQQDFVDKAVKTNIIVPLGTGTGKTFIAVTLIKELAADVRLPPAEAKRSFFLVNQVALVEQQAQVIKDHTDLTVGFYHGRMNVDMWSADRWKMELTNNQVMVMTAQVFLDMLNHGFYHLSRVNVLVVDECHHALGKSHPYRQIMAKYNELEANESAPRVLGLTASLVSGQTKPSALEKQIVALESAMCCRVEAASDLTAVAQHGAKPKIIVVTCNEYRIRDHAVLSEVYRMLETVLNFCRNAKFDAELDIDPTAPIIDAVKKIMDVLQQLGPWCAWRVCLLWEKPLTKLRRLVLTDMQRRFLDLGLTYVSMASRRLRLLVSDSLDDYDRFKQHLPPKVHKMVQVLQRFKPEERKKLKNGTEESMAALVFVEQRYVAYVLKLLLIKLAAIYAPLDFLKVDFMIGYSSRNIQTDEAQALQKRQEDVLKKFRKTDLNVLISTSVLEEGVDVKRCNLVIRYDRPKDYRSFIQSKGRARKEGSIYAVLVENELAHAFLNDLEDFEQIEEILLSRCNQTPKEAKECEPAVELDMIVPPYRPPLPANSTVEHQPQVSMKTAIALVNRYCAKLPSDIFTRLVPHCVVESVDVDGQCMYAGRLMLPINSPVKYMIQGPPLQNHRLARMAVALKCCEELHRRGELNDNLLPVGKESLVKLLAVMGDDTEEWRFGNRATPGSCRRKQIYDKKVAESLGAPAPDASQPCHVHILSLRLTAAATDVANPKNRVCVDPGQSSRVFGLITARKIPKVPAFPLYTRQGEVQVSVVAQPILLQLQQHQLPELREFHAYVFGDLLHLEKAPEFMSFDPDKSPFAPLVLPFINGPNDTYVIDFLFIRKCLLVSAQLPRRPDEETRVKYEFDEEEFADAIVLPWYREQPNLFYVAQILHDVHPGSAFPDDSYRTFNEYFDKKYKLQIHNQQQPVLDADYITGRFNLLTPRTLTRRGLPIKSLQEKQGGATTSSTAMSQQILIPELVDIHPVPASLWNIVVMLPSILYRLNGLLLADDLRAAVQQEAFHKSPAVPDSFDWRPLDYGFKQNLEAVVLRQKTKGKQTSSTSAQQQPAGRKQPPPQTNANGKQPMSNGVDANGDDFEIGVWDPHDSMLDSLCDPVSTSDQLAAVAGTAHTNNTKPVLCDEAGLGLSAHHPYADDFAGDDDLTEANEDDVDDDYHDIIFDVEYSQHYKQYEQGEELFAPSEDIQPKGWDDDAVSAPVNTGLQTGIQFLSFGKEFDSRGLLKDLAEFERQPPVPPAAGPTAAAAAPTVNGTESNTKGATSGTPPKHARKDAPNKAKPPNKTFAQLKLQSPLGDIDDLYEDDVDRRREEETLEWALQQMKLIGEIDADLCATGNDADNSKKAPGSGASTVNARVCEQVDDSIMEGVSHIVRQHKRPRTQADKDRQRQKQALQAKQYKAQLVANGEMPDKPPPAAPQLMSHEEDLVALNPHGPSPSLILQALTMCNAQDGINLERLETVGDSFLKYATTVYLYHEYKDMNEGKLSFMRSKQVSNFKLYRLGQARKIGSMMIGSKFEPQDNWLPPGYYCPKDEGLEATKKLNEEEKPEEADAHMEEDMELAGAGRVAEQKQVRERTGWDEADAVADGVRQLRPDGVEEVDLNQVEKQPVPTAELFHGNMLNQQSIPDKSIADSVEALIGVYLLTYGPAGAAVFMEWLGLKVRPPNAAAKFDRVEPLLNYPLMLNESVTPAQVLQRLYTQHDFAGVERTIGYEFRDKAFLLQSFTHASYYYNRITDCYQRLEFLGDAVLDYLITRHLYDDKRFYSPGVLTDLRSALVNNTIFASLAIKLNFHKKFLSICPGLTVMIDKFVKLCNEKQLGAANFDEDLYMVSEEDCDEGEEEDIEVPKAMGDIFESIAGAVYLDSGCSLDTTWRVFYSLMEATITKCCDNPPQSPIRELQELEPEKVRFIKSERNMETGKVRVTVDVQGKVRLSGCGRNYRIAKCTAAKRALRHLKQLRAQRQATADANASASRT